MHVFEISSPEPLGQIKDHLILKRKIMIGFFFLFAKMMVQSLVQAFSTGSGASNVTHGALVTCIFMRLFKLSMQSYTNTSFGVFFKL